MYYLGKPVQDNITFESISLSQVISKDRQNFGYGLFPIIYIANIDRLRLPLI
jgi:hypothetical protein